MSRGHDARRKAKRRQARRAAAESAPQGRSAKSRRLVTLAPILVIVAILAAVAVMGFDASSGANSDQTGQEVAALVAGIPQEGTTLGSPQAPLTLRIFADLECPTVRRFVVSYLPSIVATWVRNGAMKIEYRSLQTDTRSEAMFFRQEMAALAAGRQDKMWNFLLTFVHEQKEAITEYANDRFLSEIAAQVPDLNRPQWLRDREDPLLSKKVALGVYSAHRENFRSTPSLLLGFTNSKPDRSAAFGDPASLGKKIEFSLKEDIESLRQEGTPNFEGIRDIPTLRSSI